MQVSTGSGEVVVRPVLESDLDQVDQIFRKAFGTFLGAPDPERTFGDTDFVRTRWRADPTAAVAAILDGTLVGSNFATNWGSVGFFGPLTVEPELWNRGIARLLMETTMEFFSSWQTRHMGLFTFAQSPKHVRLYQSFGFWPRFLTAVMDAPVVAPSRPVAYAKFSELAARDRAGATSAAAELTGTVFEGLDLSREIDAVLQQNLGETVLLEGSSGLEGLAVCHTGPGTEAGTGMCYVKFAAVRSGPDAARSFDWLLEACHDLAARSSASTIQAGVSFGRTQAYTALLEKGFRTQFQGVSMHRPNDDGYDTAHSLVIDDWR